jgi:transposase InsO family protein
MSKARLVITAVVVEGRGVREVARDYGVSPGWVSRLVARFREEGDAAFEPRSRRPNNSPRATPAGTVELIIDLRQRLVAAGDDAGPETIRWHLAHHHGVVVSAVTISRHLHRAGLVTPQPHKRPRSSYVRFQAEQPNETWQADFTHYRLATGADIEVLCWLDDHARYALRLTAHRRVTGPIVLSEFRAAVANHGVPASTLTDNGMVFTTRYAGGKGGRNGFEAELRRLGVTQKNSRPNHPTTCGKVERFHQTLKRWLTAQPEQPATIAELQTLLDLFAAHYNHERPHRSLLEQCTPAVAYHRRPKATARHRGDTHDRVRHDVIDNNGKITLRVNGRMHHIGVGVEHRHTRVIILAHDLDVRVVHTATGELIRTLTIDPTRDYQPLGRPPGPKPGPK